jgi:hypothetical protein
MLEEMEVLLASFEYKCEEERERGRERVKEREDISGNVDAANNVEAFASGVAATLSTGNDDIIDIAADDEEI